LSGLGVALVLACSGRSLHDGFVSSAMHQAVMGANPDAQSGRYKLLAGDMHCHVAPPDGTDDVSRDFAETVTLAKTAKLDFVLFTPHVPSHFFADAGKRAWVKKTQTDLRATIAAAKSDGSDGGVLFVPGFEYTDYTWGHLGSTFADLDAVLADVSLAEAKAHPEEFFESWVAHDGLLVVNHPFVTPLDSIFHAARVDLSWKAWTGKKSPPAEITAIDRLATGLEAYNAQVTHLRDALLLGDPRASMDATMKKIDAMIVEQKRRITPTGGTDSHGPQLAATTWVLAESKTIASVRAAIVEGRVCVRNPDACSLEVKVGDAWMPLGTSVNDVEGVDVRAKGGEIDVIANGTVVAQPKSDASVHVAATKGACTVVRARVDEGLSAPIYVNCF
jgi:hypothetical protein